MFACWSWVWWMLATGRVKHRVSKFDWYDIETAVMLYYCSPDKTVGVFHFQSPNGKYNLSYQEAEARCAAEDATLATLQQLSAAQQVMLHVVPWSWSQVYFAFWCAWLVQLFAYRNSAPLWPFAEKHWETVSVGQPLVYSPQKDLNVHLGDAKPLHWSGVSLWECLFQKLTTLGVFLYLHGEKTLTKTQGSLWVGFCKNNKTVIIRTDK